ncbi:MAG: YkvA family protein [Meiothermus sp.]|uniref:YkvA family protein n=1 Tax=Meiothermus sp. TaxID=1955249 RepID=UPI0028CF29C2|nr:YkvA family protein [Meiothermus sp.]MDT7919782.1 YkvA family protein [Meiothermus sp.]
MANEIQKFEVEVIEISAKESYSDTDFWLKLRRFARKAGREVVEKALWLYYAMQRPETPVWAKRTIIGALVYFLLPFDLVADLAPLMGFSDDLSVLLIAVSTVAAYITPAIKDQARRKASEWFD